LDVALMVEGLRQRQMDCIALKSAAVEGNSQRDRRVYLRRPDLGRCLHADSSAALQEKLTEVLGDVDVVFVIADGLSALAVERHALPLLDALRTMLKPMRINTGPVCVVSQARVAIGDEIGSLLRSRLSVVFIGERPGLSAPDSLGVYITWKPQAGRTDADRNCISNIHQEGLTYKDAAERIHFFMNEALRLRHTGFDLKHTTPRLL